MDTQFHVIFTLPATAVHQILVDADSGYWLNDYDPSFTLDEKGGVLVLGNDGSKGERGEYSGETMEKAINVRIDAAAIGAALARMATGEADYLNSDTRAIFAEVMGSMDKNGTGADAAMMDCVLQVAVFGKIIYG